MGIPRATHLLVSLSILIPHVAQVSAPQPAMPYLIHLLTLDSKGVNEMVCGLLQLCRTG